MIELLRSAENYDTHLPRRGFVDGIGFTRESKEINRGWLVLRGAIYVAPGGNLLGLPRIFLGLVHVTRRLSKLISPR